VSITPGVITIWPSGKRGILMFASFRTEAASVRAWGLLAPRWGRYGKWVNAGEARSEKT
jgi:hypothetical protein